MRILPLAVTVLLLGLTGCTEPETSGTGAVGRDSCDGVERADLELTAAAAPVVALATSHGCIVAELHADQSPITVGNFLNYTDEGFYTDLLFHRVIKDFMVQTGGMGKDGQFRTATHPPIKNEALSNGLRNTKYTLAMARTGSPDSATSQFFINHDTNCFLDPRSLSSCPSARVSEAGYAVFGTVVQGQDVVDAIANVPVESYRQGLKCQQDSQPSCPIEDVDLFSVKRVA